MSADRAGGAPQGFTRLPVRGYLDSPPPAVNVHVEFGARSVRGPRRSVNQDHYVIMRLGRYQDTLLTSLPETPTRFDEVAYGMVIADGVGLTGEIASRLAINTLSHLVVHFGKWNVRIDEPTAQEVMDRAERFYKDVNLTLAKAGKSSPLGLQSTMTAVFTAGADLIFAHVGHSRAYLFRDGKLMQLTHDHPLGGGSGVAPLTLTGARDLDDALTETIGRTGGTPKIEVERSGLLDGDAVLLCTNGLTDVVDDVGITNAPRRHSTPDDQCHALVHLALDARGDDDVTAVVAHYRVPR
jgi:protein phosphatase